MVRPSALALALLATLGGCAVAAEPAIRPAAPPMESPAMPDLTLGLRTPATHVLSGETFAVEVTVANRSGAAVDAPAEIGDGAFRFRLRPLDGGAEIAVSRDALSRRAAPGGVERMMPQSFGIRQMLGAGESRTVRVWPAALSETPFPPGRYEMSVEMLDGSAAPSPPSPLTVTARNVVAHLAVGAVGLDRPKTLFVHEADGAAALFAGAGDSDGPAPAAGLRLADLEGPPDAVALAQRRDGRPGAVAAGWLRQDGFTAVAARAAYVVATAGLIDLGLAEATLAPLGWEEGAEVIAAAFALMGAAAGGVEVVLVSLGVDTGWKPEVRRMALPLPGLPALWRATRWPDGALTVFAAFPNGAGGTLQRVTIAPDGAAGPAETVLETPAPIIALSAPLDAADGAMVQALSGPVIGEDHARMALHLVPVSGGPALEREFLMPLAEGAPPGQWALAEGAPRPAHLAATIGDAVLGLRFGDEIEGMTLTRDARGARGLATILVVDQAWAIWRDPQGQLRQQAFPR